VNSFFLAKILCTYAMNYLRQENVFVIMTTARGHPGDISDLPGGTPGRVRPAERRAGPGRKIGYGETATGAVGRDRD
jgi:hypothetical protein